MSNSGENIKLTTLTPASALDGIAVPGRFGALEGEPGVTITELQNAGLATLAGRKGQAVALGTAILDAYGIELPERSAIAAGRDISLIGYGPQQWLAVSETFAREALAEEVALRVAGLASVSDQSGGRVLLRVKGPRAADLLAKGLAIDLDPRAFPPGSTATSAIALMAVQLWRSEADVYQIAVSRSLSESFWRWLSASAAEFGYEVSEPVKLGRAAA